MDITKFKDLMSEEYTSMTRAEANDKIATIASSATLQENLNILQEELAELIQAVSKYNRNVPDSKYMLLEEIADVTLAIWCLRTAMSLEDEDMDHAYDIKLNRAYEGIKIEYTTDGGVKFVKREGAEDGNE